MAALALKAEKKILRKAVTAKLRDLSAPSVQDQSRALTARVLSLPSFVQSNSISCYLSMPSGEIDTSSLVREILRAGKTLFVPKIDPVTDGRMNLLQIYDEDDLNSLPSGVWGSRNQTLCAMGSHLAVIANNAGLDMILVPGVYRFFVSYSLVYLPQGLAFDRSLSRLGHGKGYYDRFITAYTKQPTSAVTGFAPAFLQVLDSDAVPTGGHDWKMDYIVTEQELIQH
ncbi:hypothetical protein B0H13DRAFT_2231254 [Mycena leptocephala]|nr:hypothetical protein B0H13DRAFT_2231254 [Mycena leptocephala]